MFEKLCVWMNGIVGSLLVEEFNSMAISSPRMVTIRADIFVVGGIVIVIIDVGGMFVVRVNPAKMLPMAKRIIGLVRFGLFSLIGDRGRNRGWFSNAKKIIRILYIAVSIVAISVRVRAHVLV